MIRFFIDHPVITWMTFAALLVSGLYALPRLDVEAMPETELPSLTIHTSWLGASPQAVQRSITVPIEEAARRVHGVEKVVARSSPGRSEVAVSFRRDTDIEFARLELAEHLGAVRRELPPGASPPQVVPLVPEEFRTDDFFTFSLISPLPANELRDKAETWLVPRLLAVPGVADAELQGGSRPLVRIYLDLPRMERYGLTADGVWRRLDSLDEIIPAGSIRDAGRQLMVTIREPVDIAALRRAVLDVVGGQPIPLSFVATVEPGYEDPAYFVRINGENVIQATVARRSGENAVAVSRAVREALPRLAETLPFPVSFEIDQDLGKDLEDKLRELVIRSLVILGLLFTLLAAALRRVRITAVVIASILLAVVICLSLFYFFEISVNFITISGLTVSFGMLLDNSILVLDAIHRRLVVRRRRATPVVPGVAEASGAAEAPGAAVAPGRGRRRRGEPLDPDQERDLRDRLVEGAREVAFPVLATTITTVVAFLSFSFLSGRLSLYYGPLAASIGLAMLASILVAFGWVPMALRPVARSEMAGADDREGAVDAGLDAAEADDDSPLAAEADAADRAHTGRRGASGFRPVLAWWATTLVLAVVAAAVAAVWKGPRMALDLWPWAAGIGGLLAVLGPAVVYIERLTALQLRFWPVPILLTAGLAAGAWHVYDSKIPKGGFWQASNEEELQVYIERPVGTDVLLSTETMKLFEQEILPLPDGVDMKSWSFENRGFLRVTFEPERLRSEYPELFRNRLILLAEEMGGMFIYIGGFGDPYLKGGMGGGLSNSLIQVTGYNSRTLDEIARSTMARLDRNRRVRNVRLTSGEQFERAAADETVVRIRRDRLSEYGLTVGELLGHLRRLLGIETPWRMVLDGEDERLQLAYQGADQVQYDQVMQHALTTLSGKEVRLGDLVVLETRPVLGTIRREDQRYALQINWEFIGTDRMRQRFLDDILAGIELPYGYTAEDVSAQRITQEEEEELQTVLALTLLFIFMTLAALFESLALPFLVLLAAPMALIGVAAIFWATGATFDSSARIGLVLLFGVVVNNAILLINRFRLQLREDDALRGLARQNPRLGGFDLWRLPNAEAIPRLRAAIGSGMRIQLRSILLTSGTTVVGLLPLLVQITDDTGGKDIWENLALSSIGGLVSSTVLLVITLPAFYWVSTRVGWGLARLFARLRARRAARGGRELAPSS